MNLLIIDGQGGQLGAQLIKAITARYPSHTVTAVGTNATATAAMLKAGAHQGATGENPVIVACRTADIILGPVGIVIADSLLGEITPMMAAAVGKANATRLLLPMNKCNNIIVGVPELTLSELVSNAVEKLSSLLDKK